MEPIIAEQFERELEEAVEAAMARAVRWCKLYPWIGGTSATVKDRAFEFVQEALTLTVQGKRFWKNDEVPLSVHLVGAVQSLISNSVRSRESRSRAIENPAELNETHIDASVLRVQTPEEFYLSKETCEKIETDAYELAGEDEQLGKFVEAVADGHIEIKEIAEATGLSSDQIYAAKEKLKRRRLAILKKEKKQP